MQKLNCIYVLFSDFIRVRTARKKPGQEIPCVESLPSEYSSSEAPSALHENTTSELPLEKPPRVCTFMKQMFLLMTCVFMSYVEFCLQ